MELLQPMSRLTSIDQPNQPPALALQIRWHELIGRTYTGRRPVAMAKQVVFATAIAIRSIDRPLFPTSLLAAVHRRSL